jgi:DNA repair photolyase
MSDFGTGSREGGLIVSASRRTDIPAFYPEWFFRRLEEGFVLVRNPVNPLQVRRVALDPGELDCIVFWTKNPGPMLPVLKKLEAYHYYFQFTLNAYEADMEPGLPRKETLIDTFKALSEKTGPRRLVWRYDPILINEKYPLSWHVEKFGETARALKGRAEKVIISFIDLYAKTVRNTRGLNIREMSREEKTGIAGQLARIAGENGLAITACAEDIDLSPYGIDKAKCIDDKLIEKISGRPLNVKKDRSQRPECGCVSSVDIGAYNCCPHGCRYCYANHNDTAVLENLRNHDPLALVLIP